MFGREIVKREQHIAIFDQALACYFILRTVLLDEVVDDLASLLEWSAEPKTH